jgi:isopentenyl-diphosphate delta-isomerase
MEQVILVNELDQEIGLMEKMEAHRQGKLHRAFSVLLFNSRGDLLLQKRAQSKYHSGGLWTNTCCSHPRPDETMEDAIRRKLMQEMGIDASPVYSHKFIYKTSLADLIENEMDYVYVGQFDGKPVINHEEVEDWKYVNSTALSQDISRHPEKYTHWFKLIMNHKELVLISQ